MLSLDAEPPVHEDSEFDEVPELEWDSSEVGEEYVSKVPSELAIAFSLCL